MKKYEVDYCGGDSRTNPGTSIDYMLCTIPTDYGEEVELYAEMVNDTWDEERECFDDETATYDELKEAIIEQAEENGIDVNQLHFMYD